MTLNEKIINYKIIVLIDIYNFGFDHFRGRLIDLNFNL
jgi:hypothetical protein